MKARPLIDGWTSDEEAAELARLAAGQTVLEVGTFKGFGAVLMAQAGATVWALDWHRGDADLGPRDTLCAWWTNIRRHHVEDQVVGLVGRSAQVMANLRAEAFDMAFIDAAHDYGSVRQDLVSVRFLIRPEGLIVCHDYCPTWPGVVQAVDEAAKWAGIRLERVVGSLAVLSVERSLFSSD